MYDDCFLPRHGHRELFFLISTWTIVCLCLAFIFLVNKRFTKRGWQKAAITRLDQTRPGQEGVSSRLGRPPLPSFSSSFFTSAASFHGSNCTQPRNQVLFYPLPLRRSFSHKFQAYSANLDSLLLLSTSRSQLRRCSGETSRLGVSRERIPDRQQHSASSRT